METRLFSVLAVINIISMCILAYEQLIELTVQT
jgi:hypothetical protein